MEERWRNPDGSVSYSEYIASQEWRRRRRTYLAKWPLCNRCGMDAEQHKSLFGTALHVHHVSYARLGAELDEDLEALCKNCHNDEESATYDPTELGDHLAVELGVGVQHGHLPVTSGFDVGVIDLTSPPEKYWLAAVTRIEMKRRAIAGGTPTEEAWNELGRLDGLEKLARAWLVLACPEYATDSAAIDVLVRQAIRDLEEE